MAANGNDSSLVTLTVDVNMTSNNTTGQALSIIDFYGLHAPVALAIDRVVTPIFYLIGLPCNPLCAYIWLGRHTRRSNSSAIYLGALSISHTFFLSMHIFIELNYAWGIKTFDGYVACELFYSLYYWPQYLAPLLVLGFTVERYIAVCYPFAKEKYCTVRRAVFVVLGLLLFCLLLSSVQAYLWTFDEDFQYCNHRQSLRDSAFPLTWTWVTELGMFAVAPLAALAFNILVIREIRAITRRGPAMAGPGGCAGAGQNQASTMTLLCVSFYLICTWIPATLVYSLEREFPLGTMMPPVDEEDSVTWQRHFTYMTVRKAVEEITLSNSACYFFIYYLTGKHFRDRFTYMMCPRACHNTRDGGRSEVNGSMNGRSSICKQYIAVPGKDNGNSTTVTSV